MALLVAQQIVKTGLQPVYGAVAASDTITADTDLFLHVKNVSGSNDTVAVTDGGVTPGGSAGVGFSVVVPLTTGDRMIPIPASFVNPTTGLITVTHTQTASVTCALIRGA